MAPENRIARLPLLFRLEHLQEPDFPGRVGRNGQAIAIQEAIACKRRQSRTRVNDPDQIERVGPRQRYQLSGLRPPSSLAQRRYRLRQRVLFSRETCDETAAPNLAPRLQAPAAHEDLAPGWQPGCLPRQELPENDTPA